MDADVFLSPSPWVCRFAPQIVAGGQVLDLACGSGRHVRWLAAKGYNVEAVDRDAGALAGLADLPEVVVRQADLEGGPWPYFGRVFAGIVVTNYLHRALLPHLLGALDAGGVLIYETFMAGNERFGKPANPAHLLRPGELLDFVHSRLAVLAFEQGEVRQPRPAVVQRLCAIRGAVGRLPESS
jgi:SAM-dependent methyltransferase